MQARTIQQICNDWQYIDSTKDGVSMNERSFIAFVKSLVKEYGEYKNGCIFITLDDLPSHLQQEYLKQYYFFEGYIEEYQSIFSRPSQVKEAIEEERANLNFWLKEYVRELEEEFQTGFIEAHNLVVHQYKDNGERYLARR